MGGLFDWSCYLNSIIQKNILFTIKLWDEREKLEDKKNTIIFTMNTFKGEIDRLNKKRTQNSQSLSKEQELIDKIALNKDKIYETIA